MKAESIKALLFTVCEYNNVKIVQTFSKGEQDWIQVRCLPSTSTLELTFLQDQRVAYYDSVDKATEAIDMVINSQDFS